MSKSLDSTFATILSFGGLSAGEQTGLQLLSTKLMWRRCAALGMLMARNQDLSMPKYGLVNWSNETLKKQPEVGSVTRESTHSGSFRLKLTREFEFE